VNIPFISVPGAFKFFPQTYNCTEKSSGFDFFLHNSTKKLVLYGDF